MRRAGKPNPVKRLTNCRTVAIGEYDPTTGLDNARVLRGHDISAKIEFARRDADHGDHQRSGEPDHHTLEAGGAVYGVHRPVQNVLRGRSTVAAPSRHI